MLKKFWRTPRKTFWWFCKSRSFLRFSGYIRIDKQNGWLLRVQHTPCVTDKIPQYSQENTCARVSFFIKVAGLRLATSLKSDSGAGIFLWVFQNVYKHFFPDRPWMTASALKQLLALYFPIIYIIIIILYHTTYNVHPYISKILQISLTQTFFFFFIYFEKCLCYPCRLRKAYALLRAANRFVRLEIPKHDAFDLIDETFFFWIEHFIYR